MFAAWTEVHLLAAWVWAGIGRDPVADVDLRVGGAYRVRTTMGTETWAFRGTFEHIDAPHALTSTLVWEADVGYPPGEERIDVRLEPNASGTKMRFVHGGIPDARSAVEHEKGWNQAFDGLERVLASM